MSIAVAETNEGGDSNTGTSVSITMPSTKVGRLVICISTNGPPSSVTWPGGWDVLIDDTDGDGTTSGFYAAERELDGTEGSSITVTLGSAQNFSWVWTRYTGHGSAAALVATVAEGDSAIPDPPNLDASLSKEYMWIAGMAYDNGTTSVDTFPSNYSLGQVSHDWSEEGFSSTPGVGMASRLLTASAENPGTFGIDAADQWLANTFALSPPSAVVSQFRGANRGIARGVMRGVG